MTSHSFLHFFHAWSTINGTWQLRLLVLPLVPYSPRIQVGGKPPTKSMVLIFLHFFLTFLRHVVYYYRHPRGQTFLFPLCFSFATILPPESNWLVNVRSRWSMIESSFFLKGKITRGLLLLWHRADSIYCYFLFFFS